MRDMFRKGDTIYRNIEGLKFAATILEIDYKIRTASISYLDDGNREDDVDIEDLSILQGDVDLNRSQDTETSGVTKSRDTLPRPLAGLVEDDYEVRKSHLPKVVIHDRSEEADAILLHGAENKLAAGGGIRALRYLKK